jgi:hypothetical protein
VFERFTDRARRVLVLAQEEARLLNHSFIGTEHILLGLIHEGEGVAAKALEQLGISLDKVRSKVQETIGLSGTAPTGSPPFTPRAKKVLELSLREALQLGHNYIGTEHMLLVLVREGEGVAAQVLVSLGADLARVRQQVIQLLTGYQGKESVGAEPGSPVRPQGPVAHVGGVSSAGTSRGTCSFCGRDLWEVDRYVWTGVATICAGCVALDSAAIEDETPPGGEVAFPPRLFGSPPDDGAVAEVVAAFQSTFGPAPRSRDAFEDAEDLEPYLEELESQYPVRPGLVRVASLRFIAPGWVEVEFVLRLFDPALSIEGNAVCQDGRWMVTRPTVVRALARAGIAVPPSSSLQ